MRFYPFIKRNKKKTRFVFPVKDLKTTRASLGVNPLQTYNPVGLTTVPADTVVTHGGMGYVGGDTVEFTYDFGTKVAGSVAECPCKIYRRYGATIGTPTDSWAEWVDQASIDFLKSQDNTSLHAEQISTNYAQIMAEIDLTQGVCNPYFGGSNAAMKAAFKNFTADVFAKAKGANLGVATDGLVTKHWDGTLVAWNSNATSSIAKITNSSTRSAYIDSNNKFYIIMAAQYPSDGTIPSSIDLDFIQVRVQFTKPADVVQPKTVTIPSSGKFAVVIKGFSPSWDTTTKTREVLLLYKNDNNRYYLQVNISGNLVLYKTVGGVTVSSFVMPTWVKYKSYNIIIQDNPSVANSLILYCLPNNGTMVKGFGGNNSVLNGVMNLYSLELQVAGYEGEGFAESITFYPNKNYDDTTALAELQSTSELFDINQVQLHANAVRDGNAITLNATAAFQTSYVEIPVLPNNRYEVTIQGTSSANASIDTYYNNVKITNAKGYASSLPKTMQIITESTANKIRLNFYSSAVGTFTYKDISVKLKM